MFSDIRKAADESCAFDTTKLIQLASAQSLEFDLDAYRTDYELARIDYLQVPLSQFSFQIKVVIEFC